MVFASSPIPDSPAVHEGIALRPNSIDPMHQHSDREWMFRILLNKYNLIPANDPYLAAPTNGLYGPDDVQMLLSNKSIWNSYVNGLKNRVKKYHYNYGICKTNDYPTALEFMEAASKELGRSSDTDKLIIARYHLLSLCLIKKSDLPNFLQEFNAILLPLRAKEKYTPWADYLDGARYFYESNLDKSKNKFLAIKGDSSGWLKDTADYMKVRCAMKTSHLLLSQEIEKYLSLHPRGRYADTVKNLKRYVFKKNIEFCSVSTAYEWPSPGHRVDHNLMMHLSRFCEDDVNSLVSATHRDFIRIFSKNSATSTEDKLYFLTEAIEHTTAIFTAPMETKELSMHPLTVVAQLLDKVNSENSENSLKIINFLLGVIRGAVDGIKSFFSTQKTTGKAPSALAKKSSHIWLDRFNKDKARNQNFPGLASYFNLLLLIHEKNFNTIVQKNIHAEDFGPLYPDALILKIRAMEKLEKHVDAGKLWFSTSLKHPQYNGLTEVATGYFRAGQFAEFAKLPTSWMTTISNGEEEPSYRHTEFDLDVKSFYKIYTPYRNLLRRGFETMVSFEEAIPIYTDDTLSPIIRFLAAEPILRSYLLESNYSSFLDTAKRVFDSKFESYWNKNDRSQDAGLIVAYKDLLPTVESLTLHPDDPAALTTVGHFIYSKHRFTKCDVGVSEWELSLGICEDGPRYNADIIRPIDLFTKALEIYTLKQERTQEEAKLLRTLIYCFKGSNIHKCVRGSDDMFPNEIRRRYWQRLQKYFPKEAKRTPYWY